MIWLQNLFKVFVCFWQAAPVFHHQLILFFRAVTEWDFNNNWNAEAAKWIDAGINTPHWINPLFHLEVAADSSTDAQMPSLTRCSLRPHFNHRCTSDWTVVSTALCACDARQELLGASHKGHQTSQDWSAVDNWCHTSHVCISSHNHCYNVSCIQHINIVYYYILYITLDSTTCYICIADCCYGYG